MILIASSLFPPEPVVSANISYDIASTLSGEAEVVVFSPRPSRPYGFSFSSEEASSYCFEHVISDSYVCARSSVLGRLLESYSYGRSLENFVKLHQKNIEVIYANVWPVFSQLMLARISRKFNIPFVIHVQDVYPESLVAKLGFLGGVVSKVFVSFDKYVLRSADKVVAISNQMRRYLIATRNIDSSKIMVVRNWQDDSSFNVFRDSPRRNEIVGKCFLFLGTVNPSAGVDLLIHAFGRSGLEGSRLIIAGDGPDKIRCQDVAKNYSCDIEFIEVLPAQVALLQSKSDVLIMPLRKGISSTALPSKMTAYMFSAKPILAIVDEGSEAATIVEECQCGWVVEPENIQKITEAMQSAVTSDQDQLDSMGARAFSFAENALSRRGNLTLLLSAIFNSRRSI